MGKTTKAIIATGLSLLPIIKPAQADTTAYLTTGFQTKSNVSGFTPADNPMFNYRMGINTGKFSANIFTDYDLKKESSREIDLNFNIPLFSSKHLGGDLYAGYFNFPNSELHDMQEIGLTLSSKNLPVNASVYTAKISGKGSGNGFIVKTTLGKGINFSDKIKAVLEGRLTYNDGYFTKTSGFSHGYLKGATTIKIGQSTELDAFITYQKGLDKAFGEAFKTHVYGGVSLKRKF